MDIKEIKRLVGIISDSQISELTVSVGDAKVTLRKRLETPPAPATPTEAAAPAEPAPSPVYITAPMVGIFHNIESASAVGAPVKTGQAVGAIESMKLMNDVLSEHDGVIAEILVEDGMPVEYGQNLFKLESE